MKNRIIICSFFFSIFYLCAEDIYLGSLVTEVKSSSEKTEVILTEEELSLFTSTEAALESEGISFKESNNELTFHGYWNSSVKVYVNDILMNDPNTGKFDFNSIDIKSIRRIKIDSSSCDGAVSIYIETLSADYTGITFSYGGESKTYFSFYDISPNDTWRLHGKLNCPYIFEDGSSFVIQENFSGGNKQNHYGYISSESSYEPTFEDSFIKWEKTYKGFEQGLFNNSLSVTFSSSSLPGSTFSFINYFSFNNQNCGRKDGKYYSYENQKDINTTVSFPLFFPMKKIRLKILPSYRFSNLRYTKDAAFSKSSDLYRIHNFSLKEDCSLWNIFEVNSFLTYDFSYEENFVSSEKKLSRNRLFKYLLNPAVSMNVFGVDLNFSVPVSFFKAGIEKGHIDFMYLLEGRKNVKDFSFFLNTTRNTTTPVFQQLYYSGSGGKGNPNLKTESAFAFSGGACYDGFSKISVKPFLIFYKDKISWIPDSMNNWYSENTGSSTNYGFDFSFDSKKMIPWFNLNLNYSFCRAILTNENQNYGNQIMYTPLHSLTSSVQIPFGKIFKWTTEYKFTSKKFTSNENTYFVPAQHRLDIRFDAEIKKGDKHLFDAYLLFENLFDFKYTEVSGYPGSGISVTLGFEV